MKTKQMTIKALLPVLASMIMAVNAFSGSITWTGGGSDSNWTTTANWAGGSVPGVNDTALFTDTTSKPCKINTNVSVYGMQLANSWTGTITQLSNYSLTVGSGGYFQAGGTFTGGNKAITVNAMFTLAGGAFTCTSDTLFLGRQSASTAENILTVTGGTFSHNNGTVVLEASAPWAGTSVQTIDVQGKLILKHLKYDMLTQNSNSTIYRIAIGDTLAVIGNFTMQGGGNGLYADSGVIDLSGNAYIGSGARGGTTKLRIIGDSTQTYSSTGGRFPDIEINTSGSFSPSSGTTKLGAMTLKLVNGAFTAPSDTLFLGRQSASTVENILAVTGGTFTHNNGTVTLDASAPWAGTTSKTIDVQGKLSLKHLNYDMQTPNSNATTYRIATGDTLAVTGNFAMQGGANGVYADSGVIDLSGNVYVGTGARGGTTKLRIIGNSTQTYSSSGGRLPDIEVNTTGSLSPASGMTKFAATTLSLINGTFTAPTDTFWLGRTGTNANENILTISGGAFNANNGVLRLDAAATWAGSTTKTIDINGKLTLKHLFYGNTVTSVNTVVYQIASGDTLMVEGDFRMAGILGGGDGKVTANGGIIEIQGNVVIDTATSGGSTFLYFTGSNDQTYMDNGGNEPDGKYVVQKSGGKLTLASKMELTSSGQDLIVSSGKIDLSSYNLWVDDTIKIQDSLVQGSGYVRAKCFNITSTGRFKNISTGDDSIGVGGVVNNGLMEINANGTSCGDNDDVIIRSTQDGSARAWNGSGTFKIYDVDVKDQSASSPISVYSSTNSGNNTNFTFNDCPANIGTTWDGGGTTNNWSEAANWSNDTVPGSGDTVYFDGTSIKTSIVDASFGDSVKYIEIKSGFTDTIKLNKNLIVEDYFGQATGNFICGSWCLTLLGNFNQSGGFFNGGNNNIDINGNFTLVGGTFRATSDTLFIGRPGNDTNENIFTMTGGIFDHNNGLVLFDAYPNWSQTVIKTIDVPGSLVFYKMKYGIGLANNTTTRYQISSNDTLKVAVDFIMEGGVGGGYGFVYADSGVINLDGNAILGMNSMGGSTKLRIVDNDEQTYESYPNVGAARFPDVEVNKSAGSFTHKTSSDKFGATTFNLVSGQFIAPIDTFTLGRIGSNIDENILTISGGTFNNSSGVLRLDAASSWADTVIKKIDVNNKLTLNSLVYGNTLASTNNVVYQIASNDTLIINHEFTIEGINGGGGGYVCADSGTINLIGDAYLGWGAVGGSTKLRIMGNTDQVYNSSTSASASRFPNLEINTTGSFRPASTGGSRKLGAMTFSLIAGSFTAPEDTFSLGRTHSDLAENILTISGGTYNNNNGVLRMDGSATWAHSVIKTIDVNDRLSLSTLIYGNTIASTNTVVYQIASGDTLIVSGQFTMEGVNGGGGGFVCADSGVINLSGNAFLGYGAEGGSTKLRIVYGGTSKTYNSSSSAGNSRFPYVEVDNNPAAFSPAYNTSKFGAIIFKLISGTFTAPSDTFLLGRTHSDNSEYILTISDGTFNHNSGVVFLDASATWTHSVTKAIDVNNKLNLFNLIYGNTVASSNTTVYQIASGDTISVAGDFRMDGIIGSENGYVTANGGLIAVQGNVIIGHEIKGGSSLFLLKGSADQTLTQNADSLPGGTWTINKTGGSVSLLSAVTFPASLNIISGVLNQGFYGMRAKGALTVETGSQWINMGTGYVYLGGNVTNNGIINLNSLGEECGDSDYIQIRSTVPGTRRIWSGNGEFNMNDVDVKDMASTGEIIAYSSTNSGNNDSGWLIRTDCQSPVFTAKEIYVDEGYTGQYHYGTYSQPYSFIQDAFDAIPTGQAVRPYTIILKPGNYSHGLTADKHSSFTRENNLTIKSMDIGQKITIQKADTILNLDCLKNIVVEGIIFKGIGQDYTIAVCGATDSVYGRADNITFRKCKFMNDTVNWLTGLQGLGDSLCVENCVFYSNHYDTAYKCIDQGTFGGQYYRIVNNSALGSWAYFLKMTDLTGTVFINNVIIGEITANGTAISGANRDSMVLKNWIGYRTTDHTHIEPVGISLIGNPDDSDYGMQSGSGPADEFVIDRGDNSIYVPKDDFLGNYDALGHRDIGAFEYEGFGYTAASFYSRNQSGNVIAEFDKDKQPIYTNIYAIGLIGKEVYDSDSSWNRSRYYYIKNHLGSTMKVLNDQGTEVANVQYYSYGEKNENNSGFPIEVTETFTGKTLDGNGGEKGFGIDSAGLGVYYFGARYYDPELGIFLSPDAKLQFHSPYAYAANPIVFIDPTGNYFIIDDIIASAIGAAVGAYYAYKTNQNIFAGMLIGAGIGEAALYTGGAAAAGMTSVLGTSTGATVLAAGIGGAAGGATNSILSQIAYGQKGFFSGPTNAETFLQNVGIGALSGLAGGLAGAGAVSPWKTSGFNLSLGEMVGVGMVGGGAGGFASGMVNYALGGDASAVGLGTIMGAAAGGIVGAGKYYDIKNTTGVGVLDRNDTRSDALSRLRASEADNLERSAAYSDKGLQQGLTRTGTAREVEIAALSSTKANIHTHQLELSMEFSPADNAAAAATGKPLMALNSYGSSYVSNNGAMISFNTATYLRTNFIQAFFGF